MFEFLSELRRARRSGDDFEDSVYHVSLSNAHIFSSNSNNLNAYAGEYLNVLSFVLHSITSNYIEFDRINAVTELEMDFSFFDDHFSAMNFSVVFPISAKMWCEVLMVQN